VLSFLDDIDRITVCGYEPTDGDIVRARLRTVGVQEHRFVISESPSFAPLSDHGKEWIMYDVGGTRSSVRVPHMPSSGCGWMYMQRAAWASFFDDVDAIIFLSPISCFDERLREDRNVNRLEDSIQLWRSICSSRILAKTQIILFLNKCDILQNKMSRGVMVKDYVPSFAERKNDTMTVMKCTCLWPFPPWVVWTRVDRGARRMQISRNTSRISSGNPHQNHAPFLFTSHR